MKFLLLQFFLYIILTFCLTVGTTEAQDISRWEYGLGGAGLLRSFHSTDFRSTGNYTLPRQAEPFIKGFGTEAFVPLSLGYRFNPSLTGFLSLGYSYSSAEFTTTEHTTIVNPNTGQAVSDTATHTFLPRIQSGVFSLGARITLAPQLFVTASGGVMLPFSAKFTATQIWNDLPGIPTPAPKETNGNIGYLKTNPPYFGEVSIGTELPISRKGEVMIAPAAVVRYQVNPLPADGTWNTFSIGAGVQFLYRPLIEFPILRDTTIQRDTITRMVRGIETIRITPLATTFLDSFIVRTPESETRSYRIRQSYLRTVPKPKPLLSGNISVKFIAQSGAETSIAKVNVEQTLRRTSVPLLPYIFFRRGSSVPTEHYALTADSAALLPRFSVYDGDALVLPLYRTIFLLLAQRLREKPTAKITVTGSISPDEASEYGEELARNRAETVRLILLGISGIDSSRVLVQVRQQPESVRSEAVDEESRRVELSTADQTILEPVMLTDTLSTADPPTIRFFPEAVSEAGIVSWKIMVRQNGQLLRQIEGSGEPPAGVNWNVNDGSNRERLVVAPVSYVFSLNDAEGQTTETEPQVLEFQQSVTVREIQRRREEFSLMCFNYDETNLAATNAGQLDFIRARLPRTANCSVVGSTDTLGSEGYNRDLSLRRARVIARSLGLGTNSSVSGFGEDATTFDNGTPEGRFYSRRVRVIVDYER